MLGRIVDDIVPARSFEFENDGDPLARVSGMVAHRGDGTVSINGVKGHADEEMVQGRLTVSEMTKRMTLVVGRLIRVSLMRGVSWLE